MPFRDRAWEDAQRDATVFPAYTDYIFGPDTRHKVKEEPGLHPLLFPPHPFTPVRYTNSMPSRSWSYNTLQGTVGGQTMAGEPTKEDSDDTAPSTDLRSRLGSPLGKLIPPQSFRAVSTADMESRRMLNASQHRQGIVSATAPSATPHLLRSATKQADVKCGPIPFSLPATRAPNRAFLRSSSATDVDEHLAQLAGRQPSTLSPSPSPMAPYPAQPTHRQPPLSSHLPNPFVQTPPSRLPALLPALPQTPQTASQQIPLIQPNDLVINPQYSFVGNENRQRMNDQITVRWTIVRNHPDTSARTKAMMDIQALSTMLHTKRQEHEEALRNRTDSHHRLHIQQAPHISVPPPSSAFPQPAPSSHHLRENIDRHIPKLWHCLQLAGANPAAPPSASPEAAANTRHAKEWLTTFKASLPPEGHQYVQEVVARMYQARNEGIDPLGGVGGG